MSTKTNSETQNSARSGRRPGAAITDRSPLLWLLAGALGWSLFSASVAAPAPVFPLAPVYGDSVSLDNTFNFLTFRRGTWVIRKDNGTAQYFSIPEDSALPNTPSRIFQINQDHFPLGVLQCQLSERNLTNYLWLINPKDGKAQFVRARRDGILDVSGLLDLSGS